MKPKLASMSTGTSHYLLEEHDIYGRNVETYLEQYDMPISYEKQQLVKIIFHVCLVKLICFELYLWF